MPERRPASAERAAVLALATGQGKAPRRKPRHEESVTQRLFIARWRMDPRTRDLPACAVPNGGKRGAREAALLKAEGVSAGAPDWLCFEHGRSPEGSQPRIRFGIALEFKRADGGRQSPEQKAWQARLEAVGWRYELVTSAEAAWAVVTQYLGLAR